MKKLDRVKSKIDFQKVISSKQRKSSNHYVIYYLKNENYTHTRFGIAASKKLGCAVTRVRIRRQVRSMRQILKKTYKIEINDYVIIVKKKFLECDYQTNLNELKKLIIKSEE